MPVDIKAQQRLWRKQPRYWYVIHAMAKTPAGHFREIAESDEWKRDAKHVFYAMGATRPENYSVPDWAKPFAELTAPDPEAVKRREQETHAKLLAMLENPADDRNRAPVKQQSLF